MRAAFFKVMVGLHRTTDISLERFLKAKIFPTLNNQKKKKCFPFRFGSGAYHGVEFMRNDDEASLVVTGNGCSEVSKVHI